MFLVPVATRAILQSRSSRPRTSGRSRRTWRPSAFRPAVGLCLYFLRPVLMPVVAALVIGTTFAPIVKAAARRRISPWVTAIAARHAAPRAAGTAVTLLAQPVSEWITKAPEIGAAIKQKLYVLDRPLAALRELQEVSAVGHAVAVEPSQWGDGDPGGRLRHAGGGSAHAVLRDADLLSRHADRFPQIRGSFFTTREAKLRFIRIANDIEEQSRDLRRHGNDDQFRARRGGGDRGMAVRLAEPDHPRASWPWCSITSLISAPPA